MTKNSPKFNSSIFIQITCETSRVNITIEKINVDIVVTRPQRALSETAPPLAIMKANEVLKICEQLSKMHM